MLNAKSILITGGTGSFGQKMVQCILERYQPRRLIILSRDELKQFEMAERFPVATHRCMRYFLGDVRDSERLHEAFHGVEVVIHAAALKQVPAAEYNPFEAVKTNVFGAQNVIRAAIAQRVRQVIALSTDKAANPVNLYGATKLCSDKLFIAGNAAMSGDAHTAFSVVRYGNVIGSRGSVVPFFLRKRKGGVLPVTDARMTRFSLTLDQGVQFVLDNLARMQGGEVFVPKIPSYRILDVAKAVAPQAKIELVGIRPGEKLHELMIPEDDARHTIEFPDHFVIQPDFEWWMTRRHKLPDGGQPCPEGFSYRSDTNDRWLTVAELEKLLVAFLVEHPELAG